MNTRQAEILERLSRAGEVTVGALSERFDVSPMTIRRDLAQLERRGRLVRTHGGAVLSRTGVIEFAFQGKARTHAAEKRAIAREIAARIEPGMAVTLDTGTTTLEVARAIAGTAPLTVLTSSLAIASVLYAREGIELVLLGGVARKGSPDLSGPLTEENLRRFRAHVAVLGADGAGREGVYTTDVGVSRVSRAMIEGADRVLLAVDSSKFETTAFVRYADWSEVDDVVTDAGLRPETRRWLTRAGPRVTAVRIARAAGGRE